ncbi:MAG: UDP-N-acetylmuramoyl-L-alanyl-D-glutamate--2,6-diaminopimelate ligase, partial [Alistipes sp.]|nr:UDP-N-acetylmuramoyl-L-alanyl-D-glutamate--2,6-diaminopimelate ligase [Alistipes sp.]
MKQLETLLTGVEVLEVRGLKEQSIRGLCYDSRAVQPGECFFAVVGTSSDGHAYIPRAVKAGAAAVVCQHLPEEPDPAVSYVVVPDTNRAMAAMA